MFRVTQMGRDNVYAVEIGDDFRDTDEEELNNIHIFASGGTPVLIVDELMTAAMIFDVNESDIVTV